MGHPRPSKVASRTGEKWAKGEVGEQIMDVLESQVSEALLGSYKDFGLYSEGTM